MNESQTGRGSVGEVARYFFRLGCIAFGGPAAHLALMRRELVRERGWVSDAELMDLLGAASLIPGPNSTELSMHIGAKRAGWWGLWLAGAAFIVPAVAIVLAIAWAYVEYGDTPAGEGIILGVQPFILAIIVQAIWGLRGAVVKGWMTFVIVLATTALALRGANEILLILGAGGVALLAGLAGGGRRPPSLRGFARRLPRPSMGMLAVAPVGGVPAWDLFLVFLKIGSVLYGSGYVLAAFLQSELVDQRGWLTEKEVVDAIAAGQFTPGPLFSSATFAGYVAGGLDGALAATAGIFLPSFVFVALTHPLIPKLRGSRWAAPFLDGVNAAALALMAVVTLTLAREALDSMFAAALFSVAAVVLIRWSPNSVWLVAAGAALGLGHAAFTR
ncbi:MAG: chromate transporter [Anaerolinea sp.]|nr:chromate transporter [Anaerolinea sp.]